MFSSLRDFRLNNLVCRRVARCTFQLNASRNSNRLDFSATHKALSSRSRSFAITTDVYYEHGTLNFSISALPFFRFLWLSHSKRIILSRGGSCLSWQPHRQSFHASFRVRKLFSKFSLAGVRRSARYFTCFAGLGRADFENSKWVVFEFYQSWSRWL